MTRMDAIFASFLGPLPLKIEGMQGDGTFSDFDLALKGMEAAALQYLTAAADLYRSPADCRQALKHAVAGAALLIMARANIDPLKPSLTDPLGEVLRALRMAEDGETHPAFKGAPRWVPDAARLSEMRATFVARCLFASNALMAAGMSRRQADEATWTVAEHSIRTLGLKIRSPGGIKDWRKGVKIPIFDDPSTTNVGTRAIASLKEISLRRYMHLAVPAVAPEILSDDDDRLRRTAQMVRSGVYPA